MTASTRSTRFITCGLCGRSIFLIDGMKRYRERKILIQCYPTTPNKVLSEITGMSVSHVSKMAFDLGLKKDRRYISETNRRCAMKNRIPKTT